MFCDFKIVRLDISLDISVQTKQIKVIQDGASLGHPKKKKKNYITNISRVIQKILDTMTINSKKKKFLFFLTLTKQIKVIQVGASLGITKKKFYH